MPRLAIVSVHYYPQWCDASVRELARLAAPLRPGHCVLINNNPRLQDRLVGLATRHHFVDAVVLHDNRGLEFGAYQLGLDHALAHGEFDWVLFLNDTVATHQLFCSRHRKALAARLRDPEMLDLPAAIGRVDALPQSYEVAGAHAHRWLTTNVFALNRRALDALGGRVHCPELDALVQEVGHLDGFFSPELDETLVRHLKAWLFAAAPGPRWRDAAPLTAANAARYARKARAILQEKYLSARLEESRAYFLDLRKMRNLDRLRCKGEQLVFQLRQSLRSRHKEAA